MKHILREENYMQVLPHLEVLLKITNQLKIFMKKINKSIVKTKIQNNSYKIQCV